MFLNFAGGDLAYLIQPPLGEMLADRQQGLEFAQEPTMTTDAAMSLKGLVEEGPDAGMLREAIASTAERLIELEVSPTYVKRLSPRKRVFR